MNQYVVVERNNAASVIANDVAEMAWSKLEKRLEENTRKCTYRPEKYGNGHDQTAWERMAYLAIRDFFEENKEDIIDRAVTEITKKSNYVRRLKNELKNTLSELEE